MSVDKKFVLSTTAKALLNIIPYAGGSVASVIGDIQAERKAKRFQDFMEALSAELEVLKTQVNTHFVNQADFLDIFELTAKKIISERTEFKRKLYKDVLLHAVVMEQPNYDDVEQCIRLIENTTEANIFLLKILKDPDEHNKNLTKPVPKPSGNMATTTRRKILVQLIPTWEGGFIKENLKDLEFLGLVNEISGSLQDVFPYRGLDIISNQLTPKGERFVRYIQG